MNRHNLLKRLGMGIDTVDAGPITVVARRERGNRPIDRGHDVLDGPYYETPSAVFAGFDPDFDRFGPPGGQ